MQMDFVTRKRMLTMLLIMAIFCGIMILFHLVKGFLAYRYFSNLSQQPMTVSATQLEYKTWYPTLQATGSIRAVRGVNVTTESPGMVSRINFLPGQTVSAGQLLIELNTEPEVAQLHVLEANADLAKIVYERDKAQYAIQGVSKAILDADAAHLQSALAQVEQQKALIKKKNIVAPFAGRLGISTINPGQYLNPGDKIVALQTVDPIYMDFYLPEQELSSIKVGQVVSVTSDAYPGKVFSGKITTIDPSLDVATRNVGVEATLSNPKGELLSGMYAEVVVSLGTEKRYLTLPQTAITYNPYGDVAYYLVEEQLDKKKKDKPKLIAKQTFVTVGETRGDQIAVLTGLKEGDTVVTSGQMKIHNGSYVVVDNSIPLNDSATSQAPNPE